MTTLPDASTLHMSDSLNEGDGINIDETMPTNATAVMVNVKRRHFAISNLVVIVRIRSERSHRQLKGIFDHS